VTLQLYILRQLIIGMCFSIGGMVFIAMPGLVVNAVARIGSVGMAAVIGYMPIIMLDLLPYIVPIGFLLAVVSTYGRLAADNEWTAMSMAGISPYRLALPGLAVAVVVSAGTHYLVSYVAPHTRFEKHHYVRKQVVERFKDIPPGKTELNFGGFYLNMRRPPLEKNVFLDVFIFVPGEDDEEGQSIVADKLMLDFTDTEMIIRLENARRVFGDQDTFFEEFTVSRNLDEMFNTAEQERGEWKYQSTPVVWQMIARGEVPEKDLSRANYEMHERYASAVMCILFLLLGMPTGLILRRGTQLGALAAAVVYALVYQLLAVNLGKELGMNGPWPEWAGAWLTSFLVLVFGIFLFRKAIRA
jgi:lipopolysaccharide export LptBFGC system permease protein LptF